MSWKDFLQANFDKMMLAVMWMIAVLLAAFLVVVIKDDKAFSWAAGIEGMIIGALLRDIIGSGTNGALKGPAPQPGTTDATSTTTVRSSHEDPPKPVA